jgi:hypothetical protein
MGDGGTVIALAFAVLFVVFSAVVLFGYIAVKMAAVGVYLAAMMMLGGVALLRSVLR